MTFILVHGLGHGGWCWERTKRELEARGHAVIAPDLPLKSLSDDADVVARLVNDHEGSILVGHSYGGLVISAAAVRAEGSIQHLVYLAAAMLGAGEDYFTLMAEHGTDLSANLIESDGALLTVSPDKAAPAFYGECDEPTAQAAVAQLRPTSIQCWNLVSPVPEPWREIHSTYIVCARDAAMPPGAQRVLARKARRVAELDTDHSPFLSANNELCDLLSSCAEDDVGVAAGS